MAKGPAGKLFVVFSELRDLAETIGALAGGASLASGDSKASGEGCLSKKKGEPDGGA